MSVVDTSFDHPMEIEERGAMPFAGGIMQHGYQCGMIWGSSLAAGAQAFRLFGPGPKAETGAVIAAQRIVESFHALNKNINCLEITDIDKSSTPKQMMIYFIFKGGTIRCFHMAARYAPVAFREINAAFEDNSFQTPSSPVSCSAMLAKKIGLSELHTTMAAGLAGGIGLCGGACGALGAAIWSIGMNSAKDENVKNDYKNPRALEIIEKFLKSSDYEFECAEIVGRKFQDVNDHAEYLSQGGCSKIIDVLASELSKN